MPFAESLLILGLEGSRDESFTLWVFNVAIRGTGPKKRKKWGDLKVKNPRCDKGHVDRGRPRHT